MQPRTILITAGVALVAFAAAFGIAKATSRSDPSTTGGTGATAQTFEPASATINAKAPKAGLPALKPKPTPEPTATPTPVPSTVPEVNSGGQGPVQGGGESPVQGGGETPVAGGGETP
jgi:hypothetical protein